MSVESALYCLLWSQEMESVDLPWESESVELLRDDLEGFITLAGDLLDGLDSDSVAYDFIFTRNGHGVGFWDRGLGERGELLSDLAHSFGSIYAFVSDDGLSLMIEGG